MIFPIAGQVGWNYVAVPVWQLETPAAPAAAGDSSWIQGASPSADLAPPLLQEPRLVFKGYEWRPVAQWNPFVNPGWDHWAENDPDDIRERQLRVERERQQALAVAPAQRAQGDAPDPVQPGSSADDPHHGPPPSTGTFPIET